MILTQYILCAFVLISVWYSCKCDETEEATDLDRGYPKSDDDKLNSIRKKVLKHYAKHMTSDVESISTSNWLLERFLQEYYHDERRAERAVIEAFDYFHKEELHKIDNTFFPSEIFATGGLYRFGTSKGGQPLIGISTSHLKPVPQLRSQFAKLVEKFVLYLVYNTMFEAKEKNIIMYNNFINASIEFPTTTNYFQEKLSSNELQQLRSFMTIVKQFPGIPLKFYVIGMSKAMESQLKLTVQLLKPSMKERIVFVESFEQLEDVIPLAEVPVHAGGLNTTFVRIPPGVKSGKCLRHLSYITTKEWDNLRAINAELFEEGMKEANIDSMDHYLRSCDK